MLKRKHSYFKDDIRRMLLLYAFLPAMVLTFFLLFMFFFYWNMELKNTVEAENNLMAEKFQEASLNYRDFMEELSREQEVFSGDLSSSQRAEIYDQFYSISNDMKISGDLYLFLSEEEPILLGRKNLPYYLDGQSYGNWGIFNMMKARKETLSVRVMEESEGNMQLVFGRQVLKEGVPMGYIVIVMDGRQFRVLLSEQSSQTVVTDAMGRAYITNNYTFLDNLNRMSLELSPDESLLETQKDGYYLRGQEILEGELRIYSMRNINSQMNFFFTLGGVLLLVFGLIILLVLYSTKKMAASKTEDLYKIIDAFKGAQEGDFTVKTEIRSHDEFQTIGDSFNEMLEKLKVQIERNKEMTERLSATQLRQLRSQFNPHFLYNTLDNIRFMVHFKPEDASSMILSLSNLLRYSLDNKREEVPLSLDMEYTENYLKIMKFRFGERLSYEVRMEELAKEVPIPKLLIQPMIENAIKYGYEGKDHLHVSISAFMREKEMVLVCEDNGAGMKKETQEEISKLLSEDAESSSHLGLFNIHRRLKLRYGEGAGIEIISSEGAGTRVEVSVPFLKEMESDKGGAAG
ncbi:sensor histidine kinase [Proteiniclasticum ruminis]|uniref:Sensor histidine kinase YesM n=1 Tax=Proteiniclasticum ruminis TaxID=398199 RepID=A0A1I5E497_9CLOT|nr:sensor histidine kinase [Proteiniclasticum ruminis]SFO05991.1 Sensor histidine kinase YesM [Proteiniclasticum ruminis]